MRGRLYRSRTDRILGGIAGGIGDYFGIDPTIVRLVFVLLALWGGAGGALYIIAWIIIPREPGDRYEAAAADMSDRPRRVHNTAEDKRGLGWLMVIVGLGVVVFNTPILSLLLSPAVIVGGGLLVWGLFMVGRTGRFR